MMDKKQFAATYADLEKVPPHLVAEIIHGVLETHRQRQNLVIASAAKQSSAVSPYVRKHFSGLLRCARNDGMAAFLESVASGFRLINSPVSSASTES